MKLKLPKKQDRDYNRIPRSLQQVIPVRRVYDDGIFEIRTDPAKEPLAEIKGIGSNIWTAHECRFDAVSGTNALYLIYKGSGSCSLKSIEFIH